MMHIKNLVNKILIKHWRTHNYGLPLLAIICIMTCFSNLFAGPKIEVDSPIFDFGIKSQGKNLTHIYKIKNIGDSKLTIHKVKPTCGCTATILDKKELEPGEVASIKTTFKTGQYSGNINKKVHVKSDAENNNNLPLTIKGKVLPEFNISPRRVNFGVVNYITNSKKTVIIKPNFDFGDFEIKNIKLPNYIKESHSFTNINNTICLKLNIELSNDISIGKLNDNIIITLNSKKNILIPVTATKLGDINCYPVSFDFNVSKKDPQLNRILKVESSSKSNFSIINFNTDHKCINIELKKLNDYSYNFTLTLKDNCFDDKQGILEFTTDREDQDKFIIPIKLHFR